MVSSDVSLSDVASICSSAGLGSVDTIMASANPLKTTVVAPAGI